MSTGTAAQDVASAIIGPMRRDKRGRWDGRGQSRRSLEAAMASWVIHALETEGHRIEDLWSPDADRARRPEMQTRPDLAMTIDGEPAALDVTWFGTQDDWDCRGRASEIRQEVEAKLTPLMTGHSLLGMVLYEPGGLITLTRRSRIADTTQIAEVLAAHLDALVVGVRHEVPIPLAWVRGASLTLTPTLRGRSPSASIYVSAPRIDPAARVDQFIAERVASKGSQMAGWGHSILVITHQDYETGSDIADGFGRAEGCPWWRVYWVGRSPDEVVLAASRPERSP